MADNLTTQDALADPQFYQLPHETRVAVLQQLDPDFAKLPAVEQGKVIAWGYSQLPSSQARLSSSNVPQAGERQSQTASSLHANSVPLLTEDEPQPSTAPGILPPAAGLPLTGAGQAPPLWKVGQGDTSLLGPVDSLQSPPLDTRRDPRTGLTYQMSDPNRASLLTDPLLAIAYGGPTQMARGIQEGAAPAEALASDMGRSQLQGMGQPQPGAPSMTPQLALQGAQATHDVSQGVLTMAAPVLIPGGLAAAPLRTVGTLGAAMAGGAATKKGLMAMGVAEPYADVAADVFGYWAAMRLGKLAGGEFPPDATPEAKALAQQTGGIASPDVTPAQAADMAEQLRGAGHPLAANAWDKLNTSKPLPLIIDGKPALLHPPETAPVSTQAPANPDTPWNEPPRIVTGRMPAVRVTDLVGNTIHLDTVQGIDGWLRQKGVIGDIPPQRPAIFGTPSQGISPEAEEGIAALGEERQYIQTAAGRVQLPDWWQQAIQDNIQATRMAQAGHATNANPVNSQPIDTSGVAGTPEPAPQPPQSAGAIPLAAAPDRGPSAPGAFSEMPRPNAGPRIPAFPPSLQPLPAPAPSTQNPEPAAEQPVAPHIAAGNPAPGFPTGDTASVKTAAGTRADVVYAWLPRASVIASHDAQGNPTPGFPQEIQPRDRTRDALQAQVQHIAGNLDPEQTGADLMADRGAPIVARTSDGNFAVVSGNGRKAAFDLLADSGHANWDAYQQHWADHAQELGIDPNEVLQNPDGMLARVLVPSKHLDLPQFAAEANQDDKAAMAPVEQAKADAQRIAPIMPLFQAAESGEIVHPGNQDFIRAFMQGLPAGERAGLQTRDGQISQAGVTRIRNAVFAHAYGADTTALEKLAESPDSNIRNITAGMLQAAPAFAAMRHGVASGTLYPGTDLAPDVSAAAAKLSALRESGQTIPDYLKQHGLFGADLTPEARQILNAFHVHRNSAKKIGAILNAYAATVDAAGNPNQQGMFGVTSAPTKGELLESAIRLAEESFRKPQPDEPVPSPAPVGNGTQLLPEQPAGDGTPSDSSGAPEASPVVDAGSGAAAPAGTPATSETSGSVAPKTFWASGKDTFKHKEQIKKLGGRYDGTRKAWEVLDTPANRRAIERMSKRLEMTPPENAEPGTAPAPVPDAAPWLAWKNGQAVTYSGNGGIEQSGKLAADASGKVYEDHGPEHGGIQIRVRRGPKVRLVPADQIRSVAGKQIAAPAPAENSPAPAENSTVAVPQAFLDGPVAGSYSADKMSEKGNKIRRPFGWDGKRWVAVAGGVDPDGARTWKAYRLVPRSEFPGTPATRGARSESANDKARKSAEGFYHGIQVSERGKPMVLVGPPVRFVAGEAPAPSPEAPAPASESPAPVSQSSDSELTDTERDVLKSLSETTPRNAGKGAYATVEQNGQRHDAARHLAELGLAKVDGAGLYVRTPAGTAAISTEPELTDPEKNFIDAAAERLQSGAGFKDNTDLARFAAGIFGGDRHAGKWNIKQVYDLLEGAVAKYIDSHRQGFTPEEALAQVRALMAKLPRQVDRTAGQEAYQQFSTPPTIALLAAVAAHFQPSDTALEPSAGTAMLAAWAKAAGVAHIETNEIDPHRRAILHYLGYTPTPHDAEQLHNLSDLRPTVVIMNPPFSAAGNRGITKDQTVARRHVEQALHMLAEGGRLVAILPGGRNGFAGEGAALDGGWSDWWEQIAATYNVRANVLLPGKEYSKYGTTYPTRLVVIDKSGATPGGKGAILNTEATDLDDALRIAQQLGNDRPQPAEPGEGSVRPGAGAQSGPGADAGNVPSVRPPASKRRSGRSGAGAVSGSVEPPQPEPAAEESGADSGAAGPGDQPAGSAAGVPSHTEAPVSRRVVHAPVKLGANKAAQDQTDVAGGTFVRYVPAKLTGGAPHPAPIVQSAPLAAVEPPDVHYMPQFDPAIISDGKISNVQLEAVVYAGQRHEQHLQDGTRAGIFIGDGTGVGKGREIAAIIADNWAQGRKRAVWVSASRDLIEDAQRDLRDLGVDIPIRVVNDWKAAADIDLDAGIVFTTYSSLIGAGKEDGAEGETEEQRNNRPVPTRVDQLVKWGGDNAVLVFDEGHKMKGAYDDGTGEPTATGAAGIDLQEKLPEARVVYASATGATEVRNMAYMTRLGLWGEGTPFKQFGDFLGRIDGGGVGAMEAVARDLKAHGAYMARTLSYEGVEYREAHHHLSDEQRQMYDTAANAWLKVIDKIVGAIASTHAPGRARARAMSQFWGSHQRFFKQLITAIKIPTCIAEIQKALDNNQSIVVSVASTGEAQQDRMVQKARENESSLDDIDWSPREVLDHLITQVFPIHANEEVVDPKTGRKSWRPVKDKDGNPVIDRVALAQREALRDSLTDIALPGNPIDLLIEKFGAANVAELTGRKARIEKDALTGKKSLKKRKAEGVASRRNNIAEMAAFQDGKKRIAIISDAASTGISLHADARAKNQQQRVHIALELKWSADKQLQDFGRTHRSNEVSAPIYVLLSTDLGGDKRFSATIARRLASLGALTQGSREAAAGGEIAKYNFESTYGQQAVTTLLRQLAQQQSSPVEMRLWATRQKAVAQFGGEAGLQSRYTDEAMRGIVGNLVDAFAHGEIGKKDGLYYFSDAVKNATAPAQDGRELLAKIGLMRRNEHTRLPEGPPLPAGVPQFLNRVLSLPVGEQNSVFARFVDLFATAIETAKRQGSFDEGVEDLRNAEAIRLVHADLAHQAADGAQTWHYHLEVDEKTEPLSWKDANDRRSLRDSVDPIVSGRPSGWYKQVRSGNIVLAVNGGTSTETDTGRTHREYALSRPNGGTDRMTAEDFEQKYAPVSDAEARAWWNEKYQTVPKVRTRELHLIGGAMLQFWDHLEHAGAHGMHVIRAQTGDGQRVVGVEIPNRAVADVLKALGVGRENTNPSDVFSALGQGAEIQLAGGLTLRATKVHREDAYEIADAKVADFPTLEAAGAIAERIDGKKRFFIPTDAAAGMPVLEKILERWPVMRANTGEALHSLRGEPDGLTPDEQRVQNSVLDKLHAHPEVYLAEYTRRFGNILNTDDAAKLFPEYNHSLETRTQYRLAVQPAARWIRDELFRRALQTSSKRVAVFIGGGPGAGKSTLLRENPLIARESAVVLDAMLSDLAAVKQLVDLATGAGKHVTITYVHRDALQAYRAVLQRSVTEGRIPSVAYFLEARAGAARTIRALAQEYADDSKVAVEAIENIGESGGRPFRTIDTLPLEDYTQIRKRLYELLDAEYAAGRITEAVYRQARRDDGEGSRSLGGRPSNHRPESGRSQGTRQTLGTGERTPGEVARQPILTDSPRAVYKHGVVYVNPAALTVLHRAEKTRDDWEASHLSAPSTFALRGALMRMSMAKDADKTALQALAGVLADAQKDNASVIVCEVRPGESFASLKAKLRHERMHRAQHALSGSPSVRDHMDWDTFLQHPLAERSARALLADDYPADDPILAAEIGAHLASGPIGWRRMRLSDDEAFALYRVYVDLLNATHVKDVNAHLAHVDPRLATIRYGQETAAQSDARPDAGRESEPQSVQAGVPEAVPGRGPQRDLFGPEADNAAAEAAGQRKLTGDQLTAEFNSPTRGKLKRAPKPVQTSIFDETPEDQQGSLFSRATPLEKRILDYLAGKPGGEGIGRMREDLAGVSRPEFDRAMLALYRARKIFMDEHDWPEALANNPAYASQRAETVYGGPGKYYVNAALRPPEDSLYSLRPHYLDTATVQQQIAEPLADVAHFFADTRDQFRRVFNPATLPQAERAALNLRYHAANQAREYAQVEHSLKAARAYFAGRPWQENLDFINRIEGNEAQPNEHLQQIADVMREALDRYRDAVQALGTGKLSNFYETYFPHLWKRPQEAVDAFKLIFARRPIEGTKSFLKQRKFHSFQEGIDAGLQPVSENPVDLVLAKTMEMGRYLLAHRWLAEQKRIGEARYVPARHEQKHPRGWVRLPDPLGTVYGNPRVPVREALDKEMMAGLQKQLETLGVDHGRAVKIGGTRWGYAVGDSKITTRFGGPESVLVHELGHILDERYHLADQLVNEKPYRQELRDLADERHDNPEERDSYHRYIRNRHEKIANLVAAWVHNRRRFERIAPNSFKFFSRFVASHPELAELGRLEYGMKLQVMRNEIDTGGILTRGYYYVPAGAAQVATNYLSPGLSRQAWYRGLRAYANTTLQFALGFSGYHAGFTAAEAMVSRFATAIEAAAAGQGQLAAANALKIPVSAVSNVVLGDKIIRAYLEPAGADPEMLRYAEALVEGGGRVKMDEQYRTRFRQRFADAWAKSDGGGKLFQIANPLHGPRNLAALAEAAAWPVMEYIVPRQKVGAFAAMAERLINQYPDASREEMRKRFAEAWDSIDNRFGQMVYDNLFWNKMAKDLAMISVQSVGWNLGTFREILGGMADYGRFAAQAARYAKSRIGSGGQPPNSSPGSPPPTDVEDGEDGAPPKPFVLPPHVTSRMAYVLALPLLTGMIGATITYFNTGEGPRDWRDYFAPPTDKSRTRRISLPTYMKDVIHWIERPGQAATNKIHPWLRAAVEGFTNRDYAGTEIYDPKDSRPAKALAIAKHQAGTFVPYAVRNTLKARDAGESLATQAAPQIGITQAPGYLSETDAERRMSEMSEEGHGGPPRTPEAAARSRAKGELTRLARNNDPRTADRAEELFQNGTLTDKDLRDVLRDSAKDASAQHFNRLTAEQAIEVYSRGTPAEKHEWMPMLAHKVVSLEKRSPAEFEAFGRRWGAEMSAAIDDAGKYQASQ